MKSHLLILPLLCFVGHSATAFAQQAPPPAAPPPAAPPPAAPPPEAPPTIQLVKPQEPAPAPPPKIDLSTPAPEKPVQRTYHFHEGFYLRASVGFGYYYGAFNDSKHSDFSEHGGTMSADLLIGGSPSPGVSIGGGLLVDPLFGASYQRNGREVGTHGGVSTLIGPFIDAFPDATKGWHLGGLIGFAGMSFQNLNAGACCEGSRERAIGFGGAAWFGYDFWVAPEWAAGPQFRAMGMSTSGTHSGSDISAFASSFDLGVSVVFN
ncbi:MAG TPA: hypothetical protein VER96_00715 [Polyangiaceae bacterium]|nr:hypothetical protein [Polyangiaceae bacterium]